MSDRSDLCTDGLMFSFWRAKLAILPDRAQKPQFSPPTPPLNLNRKLKIPNPPPPKNPNSPRPPRCVTPDAAPLPTPSSLAPSEEEQRHRCPPGPLSPPVSYRAAPLSKNNGSVAPSGPLSPPLSYRPAFHQRSPTVSSAIPMQWSNLLQLLLYCILFSTDLVIEISVLI